jgi:lipopolysaccharide/colanic/teichoic acid biosynthesis glycosyltransferase
MMALRAPAKRAIDILGAAGGLIVLGPLLLLIALALRRALGAPVLLRQVRVGRHGRPFQLLKFRTMSDAGAAGSALPPAVPLARLGKWLRSTTLDGLPALINVLRGEISLVGPRPLLPEDLPHCSAKQARRHDVRPGMTGWAAVQEGDAASWERRLALDVWYVDHWSLGLDLKILLMAVVKVMTHEERPRGTGVAGPAAMPRLGDRAPPETVSEAVQIQTLLLAPEAAGWRIKRVHERAKSTG